MKNLLNLVLLFPNKEYTKYMGEVTSNKLFDNTVIKKEGLYSEDIFGPVGSEARMRKFGFINLYKEIVHPLVWINFISLSNTYKKIVEGKHYVILKNGEYRDSDEENGDTGYNYFLSTFKQLKLVENDSPERSEKIKFINSHPTPTMDKLLVYPAGLRDFNIDRHGNIKEHEMVEYYNKVISIASMVKEYKHLGSEVDDIFLKLQMAVVDLYEYLFSLIDGKNKLINKNFSTRYVDYGSTNVFTSTPLVLASLDDEVDVLATQLGLLQYIKGIDPIAKYCLSKFISERCFSTDSVKARLFNTDFKSVYVDVDNKIKDLWTTVGGMDTIFNMASKSEFLNAIVILDGYYPLVLEDKEDEVIIYTESAGIPEDAVLRGITYGEILYYMLIIEDNHNKYPGIFTRHPVAGPNSIFPSKINLNTTVNAKRKTVKIVDALSPFQKDILNTPVIGNSYMLGFTPSIGRLAPMGADHDGDKGGTRILFTEESIKELDNFMNTVPYFVNPDMTPTHDFEDNMSKFVMQTLTK